MDTIFSNVMELDFFSLSLKNIKHFTLMEEIYRLNFQTALLLFWIVFLFILSAIPCWTPSPNTISFLHVSSFTYHLARPCKMIQFLQKSSFLSSHPVVIFPPLTRLTPSPHNLLSRLAWLLKRSFRVLDRPRPPFPLLQLRIINLSITHWVELHSWPNFTSFVGVAIYFSASTHTVNQIALYCNCPNHPDFGLFSRCPFQLSLPLIPSDPNLPTISFDMNWGEIERILAKWFEVINEKSSPDRSVPTPAIKPAPVGSPFRPSKLFGLNEVMSAKSIKYHSLL